MFVVHSTPSSSSLTLTRLCSRSAGLLAGHRRRLHSSTTDDELPTKAPISQDVPTSRAKRIQKKVIAKGPNRETAEGIHDQHISWLIERVRQHVAHTTKDDSTLGKKRMTDITRTLSQQKTITPAVMAFRIRNMCDEGKLDEAIETTKELPFHLQSAFAWNHIILQALKEDRFQLAFKLYNDMKRRGIHPMPSTYGIFSTALAKMNDPQDHPKRIEMARSLLEQYKKLSYHVRKGSTSVKGELSDGPFNQFIRYFAKVGDFETVYEIYNTMEDYGVVPSERTYSAMLYALLSRQSSSKRDGLTVHQQNASDAKLLWRDAERAAVAQGFPFDSMILAPLFFILKDGRPSDHEFALEVIQKHILGGAPLDPSTSAKDTHQESALVPLNYALLNSMLEFLNTSNHPELALRLVETVRHKINNRHFKVKTLADKDLLPVVVDKEIKTLDRWSLYHAMLSLSMLSSPSRTASSGHPVGEPSKGKGKENKTSLEQHEKPHYTQQATSIINWAHTEAAITNSKLDIIPAAWDLAFLVCWRENDFESAKELFSMMTVQGSRVSEEELRKASTKIDRKSIVFGDILPTSPTICLPSIVSMNTFAQTALSTQDPDTYAHFLQLISPLPIDKYINCFSPLTTTNAPNTAPSESSDASSTDPDPAPVPLHQAPLEDLEKGWESHSRRGKSSTSGFPYLRFNHKGFLHSIRQMTQILAKQPERTLDADWKLWGTACAVKLDQYSRSKAESAKKKAGSV